MSKITLCPPITRPSDRYKLNKKRDKRIKQVIASWNCDKCRLKPTCKELCPPMEYILKQVEVEPPKEMPSDYIADIKTGEWPESPTTSETIFTMFFFDKLNQKEIADRLYISQQYVSKTVIKYKKILIKNLRKKVVPGC